MEEKSFDYINVIPLVDVMLVLLTIVLTGATFIVSGALPIQLPKAAATQTDVVAACTIEINAQGRIFFQGAAVSCNELANRLRELPRLTPLTIKVDARCSMQAFVDVFDVVKLLGFSRIDLQTEKKHGQAG